MKMQYLITEENITLSLNGKVATISRSSNNWQEVKKAIFGGFYSVAFSLMQPMQAIKEKIDGCPKLSIINGYVYWEGKELNNYIANKILSLCVKNRKIDLLTAFLNKLMQNPNKRVQDELLQFLEYGKFPICTDGDFLAYKKVREDYKDIHSGTLDYSVGNTVTMKRAECDDNSENVCSSGLHFCSFEYLDSYGGDSDKVILVKINPKDVVSIPKDYNNTKGRACKIYSVCDYTEKTDTDKLKTMDFVKVNKKAKNVKPIGKGKTAKKKYVKEYAYDNPNWKKQSVISVVCPWCGAVVTGSVSTFESGHGKVCSCGARLSHRKAYK